MSQTTNREAWAQAGWDMAIRQLAGGDTAIDTLTAQASTVIVGERADGKRLEAQRAHGEALADALEQAEAERDEAAQAAADSWGTRREADAQAALNRADAHYVAALEELGQWLALVDAIDALER